MKRTQLIINVYNAEEEQVEKLWNLNGVRHRKDGPAVIEEDCLMFFRHGEFPEDPEPAIIYADNDKVFYKNGKYSHRVLPSGETIYRKSK